MEIIKKIERLTLSHAATKMATNYECMYQRGRKREGGEEREAENGNVIDFSYLHQIWITQVFTPHAHPTDCLLILNHS